jgi:hypothetical protein
VYRIRKRLRSKKQHQLEQKSTKRFRVRTKEIKRYFHKTKLSAKRRETIVAISTQ